MSTDKLAYFRQKREGVNEYIEGRARRIDYDGKDEITILTGQAIVRKLLGLTVVLDEVQGNIIRYESQNEFYKAVSGPNGVSSSNPSGRVRAMLVPRNNFGSEPSN